MSRLSPLTVKTRGGEVVAERLIGRVGDTEIHEATEEGVRRAIRLFAPQGVLERDKAGLLKLVDPAFKTEFAKATARYLTLGRKLRDRLGPHWLRVRDAAPAEGTAAWITDLPPRSLADVIARQGRAPPEAVLAFAASLVRALEAMHVVTPHLDLSPQTIGIGDDGEVVLMHASIDRRPFIALTGSNAGAVRPGYSPIEAYDGALRQPLDALTDIYAASAVLRCLITGVEPRPWMDRRAHHGGLQPGDYPTYPVAFIYAVNRGFSVRRDDRMGSLAEWSAGLLSPGDSDPAFWIAAPPPAPAPPAPTPTPVPPPPSIPPPPSPAPPPAAPAAGVATAPAIPKPAPLPGSPTSIPVTPPPPLGAAKPTLSIPPKPSPGPRAGPAITLLIVAGLLAAGGYFGWRTLSGGDTYYASREIRVRAAPDPRTGRVVATPGRGFQFKGKPAGRVSGIDWIEITDGPYKGAYVNAPNVTRTAPPALSITYRPPQQAQVLRDGPVYRRVGGMPVDEVRMGQALTQTGVFGDWVEVLWPRGGVVYLQASAFLPSGVAATPSASEEETYPASGTDAPALAAPKMESGQITIRPTWYRTPTQAQLDEAAPRRLLEEGIVGRIVVDCEVDSQGALRDCRLVSETPAGYGMVAAARKVLPYYVMALTDAEGNATAGRRYRVSMTLGPATD